MKKLYDMKRLLFLCLCLASAMQAFAQINMKDSTAQVVAYWNKGDKYTFIKYVGALSTLQHFIYSFSMPILWNMETEVQQAGGICLKLLLLLLLSRFSHVRLCATS